MGYEKIYPCKAVAVHGIKDFFGSLFYLGRGVFRQLRIDHGTRLFVEIFGFKIIEFRCGKDLSNAGGQHGLLAAAKYGALNLMAAKHLLYKDLPVVAGGFLKAGN